VSFDLIIYIFVDRFALTLSIRTRLNTTSNQQTLVMVGMSVFQIRTEFVRLTTVTHEVVV